MIDCSCNRIKDGVVRAVVESKRADLLSIRSLLKGVAMVYRAARDLTTDTPVPPCTSCFQTVACRIREQESLREHFKGQHVLKHNRYGHQPGTP